MSAIGGDHQFLVATIVEAHFDETTSLKSLSLNDKKQGTKGKTIKKSVEVFTSSAIV